METIDNMSCNTGGVRLDSLPREEVTQWLSKFDTILTDCDGMKVM